MPLFIRKKRFWISVWVLTVFVFGSGIENKADYHRDFRFLYREIRDNYVNLKVKEKRFNWLWKDRYEIFLPRLADVQTDTDFFLLASEFVSLLKDGHTSIRPATSEVRAGIITHSAALERVLDIRLVQGRAMVVRCLEQFDILGWEIVSINKIPFLDICLQMKSTHYFSGNDSSALEKIIRYKIFFDYFDLFGKSFPKVLEIDVRNREGREKSVRIETDADYPDGPYRFLDGINLGIFDDPLPSGRVLTGGIGYILIPTFDGNIRQIVRRFQKAVLLFKQSEAPGVIIDIRYNPGGNESFRRILGFLTRDSLMIAPFRYRLTARFTELYPRRLDYDRRNKVVLDRPSEPGYSEWFGWVVHPEKESFLTEVPVVLLCNSASFSSADSFANACLNFGLAVVIGDSVPLTGHGLAKPVLLPSGRFLVRYSFHEARDVDFGPMENVIKKPDIQVEQSVVDLDRGMDTPLNSALSFLGAQRD